MRLKSATAEGLRFIARPSLVTGALLLAILTPLAILALHPRVVVTSDVRVRNLSGVELNDVRLGSTAYTSSGTSDRCQMRLTGGALLFAKGPCKE